LYDIICILFELFFIIWIVIILLFEIVV